LKSESENVRTFIPVLVLACVTFVPLIFIVGLIVGIQFTSSTKLTADSLSSWVAALATVSISVLTFILAKETWHLRNAQISQLNELKKEAMRPNVFVAIHPSIVSITFIDVTLQNLGKGIAYNVKFKFINSDGSLADEKSNVIFEMFNKLSIFKNGCSSMGLGQTLKSFLFGFGDLEHKVGKENLFNQKIKIEISFEDSDGNPYRNIIDIDFKDFEGVSLLGNGSSDPTYALYKEVEKIRKALEPVLKRPSKRIGVDVFTEKERQQERDSLQKQHEEYMKSKMLDSELKS
jgi:hypothetical protein